VIICLFVNFLLKITFLMRKENNDLLFHIVTPKVCICHVLSGNLFQHRIMGCANGTTKTASRTFA